MLTLFCGFQLTGYNCWVNELSLFIFLCLLYRRFVATHHLYKRCLYPHLVLHFPSVAKNTLYAVDALGPSLLLLSS